MSVALAPSPWDRLAAGYDRHFTRRVDRAEDLVLGTLAARLCDGREVLDLGCGTGNLLRWTRPDYYVGVDSSAGMVAEAERRHPDAPGHFVWGLAEEATRWTGAGAFDVAVCLWALSFMERPFHVVDEAARALRPGGALLVQGCAERYRRRRHQIAGSHRLLNPTTPAGLRSTLQLAGLEVVELQGFRWWLDPAWTGPLPVPLLAALFDWKRRHRRPDRALTQLALARKPPGPALSARGRPAEAREAA